MDDLEGRVESYDLGARKDLRQEFHELEAADSIDRELSQMKAKRRGPSTQD